MRADVVFLLWLMYAFMEGMREAYYFSDKVKAIVSSQKTNGSNDHVMFTIQRCMVMALVVAAVWSTGERYTICTAIACALVFPFVHDGSYYVYRHKLDGIYPQGWFSQSTSSTAFTDMLNLLGPVVRTILMGLSVATMILAYIIK